ncbi:hypothetical protein KIW84_052282, partial [Lathyrus oleraceus]
TERGRRMTKEIIRSPQTIQRTRLLRIDSKPGFPLPTPMQKTHRTRMQIAAESFNVITAEAMLVPSMLHSLDISGEHQKKRRQRTKLVDPAPFLDPHPVLKLLRVSSLTPFPKINHHHTCVKVTRTTPLKRRRISRIRPEPMREVVSEISVTILRRAKYVIS